jgi:hypothetical protein
MTEQEKDILINILMSQRNSLLDQVTQMELRFQSAQIPLPPVEPPKEPNDNGTHQ